MIFPYKPSIFGHPHGLGNHHIGVFLIRLSSRASIRGSGLTWKESVTLAVPPVRDDLQQSFFDLLSNLWGICMIIYNIYIYIYYIYYIYIYTHK